MVMTWQCGRGQPRKARCRCCCPPGCTAERRAVNLSFPTERIDMFKLYYAPGTCARASHIALEEAGAAYAAERLDFKNSQQTTPQYLAINPKGRVPALVTDRGVLTENPAILTFVAQSAPQARLL